jgi:hypothetical protein
MVYNIKKSDGTALVSIPDSTQDTTTTSLILPGRNSVSFGLAIDQNFVNLLQHFANSSAPPNAQIGQLWYDSVKLDLKVYNGNKWVSVTTGFDTSSGVATTQIGPNKTDITFILSQYQIVAVVSSARVQPNDCPDSIVYSDTSYAFAPRYPNGIYPGINIAKDPTGILDYRLNGTASEANILAHDRTVTFNGAVSGSMVFNGSSDLTVKLKDNNVYVGSSGTTVAGTWSKVLVSDGGRILEGNNIVGSDIVAALGYTPYDGSLININSVSNTVVARDQNANFAANVVVVSTLIATSGVVGNVIGISSRASVFDNPRQIYVNGDVYGSVEFDGSKNVVINSNLITTGVTAGMYNTVEVDTKGRVTSAAMVDLSPYKMIALFPEGAAPIGWAVCDGSNVNFDGTNNTTPDLTRASDNLTVMSGYPLKYYMKCGNNTVLTNNVYLPSTSYGAGITPNV